MPPTQTLDDYLEIVAAVELTAEEMNIPVILEGYEPPSDPRMTHFRVTPDPGVIEVNIHPAKTWDQLVDQTTHLYESAYFSRLTPRNSCSTVATPAPAVATTSCSAARPQRFALPPPSGPAAQPDRLLAQPSQPVLPVLGPVHRPATSQAPRVDEARNDSLYEMEIAFRQIPPVGGYILPLAGRSRAAQPAHRRHRQHPPRQFCIDKLYSPDGPTGRLGLLELRAFEMPPHARMSLAQQLLLRGLIARFWKNPMQRRLALGARTTTASCRRIFVEQDFPRRHGRNAAGRLRL